MAFCPKSNILFLVRFLQAITGGSRGKESACSAWDRGSIPGSGRSPGEGNGYPLQYSCLENSTDRGAWWARAMWGHKQSDTTEWLILQAITFFPFFFFCLPRSYFDSFVSCNWDTVEWNPDLLLKTVPDSSLFCEDWAVSLAQSIGAGTWARLSGKCSLGSVSSWNTG